MGEEEATHAEPGHGAPPESDTSKIDQPARQTPQPVISRPR